MHGSKYGNKRAGSNARPPSASASRVHHAHAFSGFTLVELSIVLVIIGLLISGLLVGQSMIQAVRTQAFVRQIQQIDIAVSNFRTKYNYLPGDSPYHSAAGDGDGWIENSTTDAGSGWTDKFDGEISNFWKHLQQDEFLDNEYGTLSADASSGVDIGTHIPQATGAGDNAGIIIHQDEGFVEDRNEYWVADFSGSVNTTLNGGATNVTFTPSQALAIDVKMDDGLTGRGASPNIYGYNGIVWAGNDGTAGECYPNNTSDAYNINSNIECYLVIKILSQQGGQ